MISLDTETTGVDLHHGVKPFLVTFCQEDGEQLWYEWEVDPFTREPQIPDSDVEEIQKLIQGADELILQNPKFDYQALLAADRRLVADWDWGKVHDTLTAGHLLASNHAHDLTSMVIQYLGRDVKGCEDRLRIACNDARRKARSKYPDWLIAKEGLDCMPSAKAGSKKDKKGVESESPWKFDAWLPKTIARENPDDYPEPDRECDHVWEEPAKSPLCKRCGGHFWWLVTVEYANSDSASTIQLWKAQKRVLEQRNQWKIYDYKRKILGITPKMEQRGVTVSRERLEKQEKDYRAKSKECLDTVTKIAGGDGFELKMPKSGVNRSLINYCFDYLKLPQMSDEVKPKALIRDDAGKILQQPSLNKAVRSYYLDVLKDQKQLDFVKALGDKQSRDTALTYMAQYRRFWIPLGIRNKRGQQLWYCLHPSLNSTGTNTLRWSSSNPNEQNISKREGFNLRYCFGPAPDREWWSLDAKNLELRIPAYESGEKEMVGLFDRPKDPPYFGSYHLLIFSILHPKEWAEHGVKCKDVYESTLYQWTKNGNFAVTYGAVEESGTADRAYHVPGAQRIIKSRLKDLAALNQQYIDLARKHGYVETIPDITVDPTQGYRLYCTRNKWGGIKETVPFNYHVQGTACWWMLKAMVRVQEYLDMLNESVANPDRDGYFMVMQVHDELVLDFPRRANRGNLPKINKIRHLMEEGGRDIHVPTPVSVEYHPDNWSVGLAV